MTEKYAAYKSQNPGKQSTPSKTLSTQAAGSGLTLDNRNATVSSEWNFDETIRGSIKGMPVELDLDDMSSDEEWELKDKVVVVGESKGPLGQRGARVSTHKVMCRD